MTHSASTTAEKVTDPVVSSVSAEESERQRGLRDFIREAWSQALVAVDATEEEVQKILSRVTNLVEMGPEEARRLGVELTEKLLTERKELEEGLEVAVRRALTPFRLPSREELSALNARLAALETRVDRLVARRTAKQAS